MTKVLIKIDNKWVHFCYLTGDVYSMFLLGSPFTLDAVVKQWIFDDFGIEVKTVEDLDKAKRIIYDNFSAEYPEICVTGYKTTDHIGVTRIWLTKKIRGLQDEN